MPSDSTGSTDHWRGLRRAPAWIAMMTAGFLALTGIPQLIVNARDGNTDLGRTAAWLAGAGFVAGAVVVGVRLLRAVDRERQVTLAGVTSGLWLAGVFILLAGPAIGDRL